MTTHGDPSLDPPQVKFRVLSLGSPARETLLQEGDIITPPHPSRRPRGVEPHRLTIGRSAQADIQLPDMSVSRWHASLIVADRVHLRRDPRAGDNRCLVDGRPVPPADAAPRMLPFGDCELTFGKVTLLARVVLPNLSAIGTRPARGPLAPPPAPEPEPEPEPPTLLSVLLRVPISDDRGTYFWLGGVRLQLTPPQRHFLRCLARDRQAGGNGLEYDALFQSVLGSLPSSRGGPDDAVRPKLQQLATGVRSEMAKALRADPNTMRQLLADLPAFGVHLEPPQSGPRSDRKGRVTFESKVAKKLIYCEKIGTSDDGGAYVLQIHSDRIET